MLRKGSRKDLMTVTFKQGLAGEGDCRFWGKKEHWKQKTEWRTRSRPAWHAGAGRVREGTRSHRPSPKGHCKDSGLHTGMESLY